MYECVNVFLRILSNSRFKYHKRIALEIMTLVNLLTYSIRLEVELRIIRCVQ
jgi:hypothetical protein